MKKPVIVLIAIIYLLAIAVVGFLGIPARVYNPVVFVEDIQLTFDETLGEEREITEDEKELWNADYKFYFTTSEENVYFYVTANVVPTEATNKKCAFSKLDTGSFYTMNVGELSGHYTTAEFNVDTTKFDSSVKMLHFEVKPTDGNKHLSKVVVIYIRKL